MNPQLQTRVRVLRHQIELEKACGRGDDFIEKSLNHKYYKREGTPGHYKYYYTEAEYKAAKSAGGSASPADQKMQSFLNKFPDNATSWTQATDELRDMTHDVRTSYNELVLNVDEDDPKAIDSLDFRSFKTPSEWNTKAKKQITELWDKLPVSEREIFIERYGHLFESTKPEKKSPGKHIGDMNRAEKIAAAHKLNIKDPEKLSPAKLNQHLTNANVDRELQRFRENKSK